MPNLINPSDLINNYLNDTDWRTKENSSRIRSFGALNRYISGEVSKNYWLNSVYPTRIKNAYLNGDIHIHDLGELTLYCCGFSLENILLMGVQGVDNIPTSSPASHFDSILNQVANLVTVYQNEISGAVAFNSVDTLLAPFIAKDNLTRKEVKQSLQNFIYSINSNSRGGAEPAFTNVTLDLVPSETLSKKNVIIGGNFQLETYGEYQREIDLFNEVFVELMLKGDSKGKPFSYPIVTYNIGKSFDWNNPRYDGVFEMAGKFGYPYFANFVNSDLNEDDAKSMCPLTRDTKVLVKTKQTGVTIREIGDVYATSSKGTEYEVWSGNNFVKGMPIQVPMTDVYEVTLGNGAIIKFGENHLQPIMGGDVLLAKNLQKGMWIPTNKNKIENGVGDYNLGYVVGAYLGDGSRDKNAIIYSLCAFQKDNKTEDKIVSFWNKLGYKTTVTSTKNNVRFVRVNGNPYNIISEYVTGENALNKGLSTKVYDMSVDFREGLLAGLISTDGSRGNKRLYTSSVQLKDDMVSMLATLGRKAIATYEGNREGRLGTNTNYRIDYPERDNYGEYFKSDDSFNYFKIVEIKNIGHQQGFLYCFQVDSNDNLFMLADGTITHNCRLRLDITELRKRNGGLFGSGDNTGSIGVVTINLPRIAYLSKNKKDFYQRLDNQLELAKESLEIKRKYLTDEVLNTGLIPAFMRYVGSLKNHFSTIGEVGRNEMCENFLGKGNGILSPEGKEFALEVGEHIRQKIKEFQVETGNLYNYEATPAEGTCYRLAKKDKECYNNIITQGTEDAPFYTNSCHIPVGEVESIKQVFDNQDELQIQYTGGTVIHLYMNGAISGHNAKSIIKNALSKYRVPYVSLSPISRYCKEHGYVVQEVDECPICKAKLEQYQRVTGYLRMVDNFNIGKKAEFYERKQLKGEQI